MNDVVGPVVVLSVEVVVVLSVTPVVVVEVRSRHSLTASVRTGEPGKELSNIYIDNYLDR